MRHLTKPTFAQRTRELNWNVLRLRGGIANLTNVTNDVVLSQKNRDEIKHTLSMIETILEKGIKTQRKRAREAQEAQRDRKRT